MLTPNIKQQKSKNSLHKKYIYRFHPVRLLYVFTAFLIINLLGTAIQISFVAGPLAVFDIDQLRHTFTGRFAVAYPQIFWFVVGVCLVATPLGWYLNRLYNKTEIEIQREEIQREINIITEISGTNKIDLIPPHKLHYENFNLGDNTAAYFPYLITPIKDTYDTVTLLLTDINKGIKRNKRGVLIIGEANAGKTRLAVEVLTKTLPTWLLLQWTPGETLQTIPAPEAMRENNIIVFIDDLQKYRLIEYHNPDDTLLPLGSPQVETLRTLLRRIRETANQVVVIATCRVENEIQVRASLGELFNELMLVRIRRFNVDANNTESAQIIEEFRQKGAEHIMDWDGTIGSLVLGLSRKQNIYDSLVANGDPAAIVLRSMKLVTIAGTAKQTEPQIQEVCAIVFGEKRLKEEKLWRTTVERLIQLQFIREEITNGEIFLVIHKDVYFEQIIIDYPHPDRPFQMDRDLRRLQQVFTEQRDSRALLNLGDSFSHLHRYKDALKVYEQAIQLDPSLSSAYEGKGNILYNLQQYHEALVFYESATQLDSSSKTADIGKGDAFYYLNRYQEALLAYERAIQLEPTYAGAFNGKSWTLFHLKRYEEALIAAEHAIRLDTTSSPAYAYNGKGNALLKLKRYQEALLAYEHAIQLGSDSDQLGSDSDLFYAFDGKGQVLWKMKHFDEAILAFDRALEIHPTYASAHNGRGNVLFDLKRFQEALQAYERATHLNPQMYKAYNNMGKTLYELRRYRDALNAHDQAIHLQPNKAISHYYRSLALKQLGRLEEARQSYKKARQLGYTG